MLDRLEDGSWPIEGRPDGRYLVMVRNLTEPRGGADAFAISTERAREVTLPFSGDVIEVELVPDEEVGLLVRTEDGRPADGKVTVSGEGVWPDSTQGFRAEVEDGRVLTTATDGFGLPGFPLRLQRADGALLLQGMLRGRYRVRVVADGYAPVEREIVVSGPTTIEVTLSREARPTRVVRTEVQEARYWAVEGRRVGDPSAGDAWTRVLWMDDRVRVSHMPTPGVFEARLDVGEWQFRLASDLYAPATLGPMRVEAGEEPLLLAFPLTTGATLSGTLRDQAGRPVKMVLHVFRRGDDGAYSRLEEKTVEADSGAFRISGLAPGSYRLSLSDDGEPVLGEFTVTGTTGQTLDLRLPR
jgi:hypothetical protein